MTENNIGLLLFEIRLNITPETIICLIVDKELVAQGSHNKMFDR